MDKLSTGVCIFNNFPSLPLGSGLGSIFVNNTEDDICVDGDLAHPVLVEKQRHEPFTRLLLAIGVDPHEPVRGSVFGSNTEDARLQLLPVLHLHLLGEVGDAPGVVVLGVWLVVCEAPGGGGDGWLLDSWRLILPTVASTTSSSSTAAGVGHH